MLRFQMGSRGVESAKLVADHALFQACPWILAGGHEHHNRGILGLGHGLLLFWGRWPTLLLDERKAEGEATVEHDGYKRRRCVVPSQEEMEASLITQTIFFFI